MQNEIAHKPGKLRQLSPLYIHLLTIAVGPPFPSVMRIKHCKPGFVAKFFRDLIQETS